MTDFKDDGNFYIKIDVLHLQSQFSTDVRYY